MRSQLSQQIEPMT